VEVWADENIMVVDDDGISCVVDVFEFSLATKSASAFTDAGEGDVVNGGFLVEVANVRGACFAGAIVGGHVEGIRIEVDDVGFGLGFQFGHEENELFMFLLLPVIFLLKGTDWFFDAIDRRGEV
jgi:hypothetical protein